ncbi:unnamed protein product [Symbiodinium necroappetens]|uniref:Uncharacterized protein n=1 Tax=Symbiodinium necroappetens TaxID=1628268 RepID=A0A813B6N7_9DINO|nr:unnamed protein product [Symbiodinium necroappetens]
MPQNLSDYISRLIQVPRTSPFALALQNSTHMLAVPTRECSIYSRLWCGYEAYLATYYNKVVITARPSLEWLPSLAVGMAIWAVGAIAGFFWSTVGAESTASSTATFETWKSVTHALQVSYALGMQPPFAFEDAAAGCVVLVVLCGRSSHCVAFLNLLGALAVGFILGFWAKIFGALAQLPLRIIAGDPTGKFFLIPLFAVFVATSEMDRLRALQRKQEATLLELPQNARVQDAQCGKPEDTLTITNEIGDRWGHVEASVKVLLDSGMSTPALREVTQHGFSVRGLADVKFSRCWLGLAVWLFHFLLYGGSDAVLGVINGMVVGVTVVLWCNAERDDKAFLGSMSVKIVITVAVCTYAISYAFHLDHKLDEDKKARFGDFVLLGIAIVCLLCHLAGLKGFMRLPVARCLFGALRPRC